MIFQDYTQFSPKSQYYKLIVGYAVEKKEMENRERLKVRVQQVSLIDNRYCLNDYAGYLRLRQIHLNKGVPCSVFLQCQDGTGCAGNDVAVAVNHGC